MTEHRVGSMSELAENVGIAVDIGDKRIAIFRRGEDVFAIDETCPHRGAPLHQGTVLDGIVICPWHQWQFDLRTGCSPVNPLSRVETYAVRIEDGVIFVEMGER